MKWLLFFFLPFGCFAQTLKPGLYRDLKPSKLIELDTGIYTFINLQMKNLGKVVWLDGRKAKSLTLQGCRFEGNGSGKAVVTNGEANISNSTFTNMETGIQVLANPGLISTLNISHNRFTDNTTSISLSRFGSSGTATLDFTLKCNQFKLTCADGPNASATACDNEPLRKGLLIGEGMKVEAPDPGGNIDNAIGGTDIFSSGNAYPNANDWPVAYGTDRSIFPATSTNLQASWNGPLNWQSLVNHISNPDVTYKRYKNEFVQGESVNYFKFFADPTSTFVKTEGTPPNTSIEFENSCEGLIQDPDPIFPARINVVTDSLDITSVFTDILNLGPWLSDPVPNPAQTKTEAVCFIPRGEEMAILQFIELGSGKVISAKQIEERGKLKIEIDLSRFPAGTYGFQVILKDKKLGAKRFVVIK